MTGPGAETGTSDAAAQPRRGGNLLLAGASLLIALVAAEGLARWLLIQPPKPYPETLFSDRAVRISNSAGFRDFEYPKEKPAGVFRIAAVGDSFTQAAGVNFDDAWSRRLERYLNEFAESRNLRYEVMNMGMPGTSTPRQVTVIRHEARAYRPDLVILGYCLNDAEDEDQNRGAAVNPRKVYSQRRMRGRGLKRFLYDHVALYRLVRERVWNTKINRMQHAYYREIYREDYSGWRKSRAAIRELGTLRRDTGLPVVAVIFPLFSWPFDERYPFRDVHESLHREFEAAGIPYLDLLPVYRGLDHKALQAVPFKDPHPSDVAHRLAAEHLYVWLADNVLPPGALHAERTRLRGPAPPY